VSTGSRRSPESRRRFRRLTVRLLVDFVAGGGMRCEYATTLGAGGLFIECEDLLPAGTRLKLRFRLPGGDELHEIEGRVCWLQAPSADATRAPGMGVEFTDAVGISALARALERFAG
jgi:uncharacterized protein (TIGR02266 family)